MRSFLQQFGGCLELLRQLPPEPAASTAGAAGRESSSQQQQQQDIEMAEPFQAAAAAAAAGEAGGGAGGTGGTPAVTDPAKAYRQSVEATVGTFLVLMTNMRQAKGWGVRAGLG